MKRLLLAACWVGIVIGGSVVTVSLILGGHPWYALVWFFLTVGCATAVSVIPTPTGEPER